MRRVSNSVTNKQSSRGKDRANGKSRVVVINGKKHGTHYDDDAGAPHDPFMERNVLGTIMTNGPAGLRQCVGLTAKMFHLQSHRSIYRALTELVGEGVAEPNMTKVGDRLKQSRELESIGGLPYLAMLTEGLPRDLNITYEVSRIIEFYTLREMIDISERTMSRAQDGQPSADVIARLQSELRGVMAETRNIASAGEPSTELILTRAEKFVRRFWILPKEDDYLVATMWYVATHLAMIFDVFPYLYITAPEKRCGKTRGLELGDLLCANPWMGITPSTASLYRMMMDCPTLLIDEVQKLFPSKGALSETQSLLLAVMNAGYRKGMTVPRWNAQANQLEKFPVYGPKAMTGIGPLPSAISELTDRCITITVQRRLPRQRMDRFLVAKVTPESEALRRDMAQWAEEHGEEVRAIYGEMAAPEYLSDRDAEIWMPLLTMCEVAEPEKLPKLVAAAKRMCGVKQADAEEDSTRLRHLKDIQTVWPDGALKIGSADLLARLLNLPESPWREYEWSERKIAKALKNYEILPKGVRVKEGDQEVIKKGYRRDELEEAWERYSTYA